MLRKLLLTIMASGALVVGCYEPLDWGSKTSTWHDSATGLTWQGEGMGTFTFDEALSYCSDITIGEYSDWRLPTIYELRSLVDGCTLATDCEISHATCTAGGCPPYFCDEGQGPGDGGCYWNAQLDGSCDTYWSSTECYSGSAWNVSFSLGIIGNYNESNTLLVRCVRGGN